MSRRWLYGAAALVLLTAGCASTSGTSTSGASTSGASQTSQGITKTTIKLGTTLPLTGGAASAGAAFKAGLQASVDEINAAGGINGRTIDLTILDDGFQPARSVANILRMTEQDKVFALDMPVGSAEIPGSFPLVKRTGVPMFGPYLPPDPDLPSAFLLATPHKEQGEVMADWLSGRGVKKVAYIGQDNDYGHAVLDGLNSEAAKVGLTVVATGLTETNSTNVGPAVLSTKKANPEAVVLGTDNTQTALVLKQAKQLGWSPLFVGDSSASNTGTQGAVGPAGDAANGLWGAAVAALPGGTSSAVQKYRAAMMKTAPDEVDNLYSLIAYGTNQVLFHILQQMGDNLDWSNFQKVAESLNSYQTDLLPPITFGPLPGGHTGAHGVLMAQYDQGKWTAKTDFLTVKN